MKKIKRSWQMFCVVGALFLAGCTTAAVPTAATGTEEAEATEATYTSLAPERVDVRGTIIRSRYNQGQVVLEVDGTPMPESRYARAYVLVPPTAQIIDVDGDAISLHELHEGQEVAIELRGGGNGTFVGVGLARKMWLEDRF